MVPTLKSATDICKVVYSRQRQILIEINSIFDLIHIIKFCLLNLLSRPHFLSFSGNKAVKAMAELQNPLPPGWEMKYDRKQNK